MRRLAPAVVGLAVFLVAATGAKAATSEFYGIASGPYLSPQDLQGMAQVDVRSDRFMFPWHMVEPGENSYNWNLTDQLIGGLASHGIRPVPFVWGSPSWTGTGGVTRAPVSAADQQAWTNFLRAAVSRYGPGGSYWANDYEQQFGTDATPEPIKSWQIWNEPNLKFVYPGSTIKQRAQKYGQLLRVSHDAILAVDPHARIVLAGMAGYPKPTGWDYLNQLYLQVPGVKADFDAAAINPYAPTVGAVRDAMADFRNVMDKHGDAAKPLWITEFAWGSAPHDPTSWFDMNVGMQGQADLLVSSYDMFLRHRTDWNVQRLFWFLWRDQEAVSKTTKGCGFCESAGLLTNDGTEKPAYHSFMTFTTDATPPQASITGGPADGGTTTDHTPAFSFVSSDLGSTFVCEVDTGPYKPCTSPDTLPKLGDGPHSFSLIAVDPAGNLSTLVSTSFTEITLSPAAPRIRSFAPRPPANHNALKVRGSAKAGTTVTLYKATDCSGPPVAQGSADTFASPGLPAIVPDNTSTSFTVAATDSEGQTSPCSKAHIYVEDSTPPQTTITSGPSDPTTDATPTFGFASNEPFSTFRCRYDDKPYKPCSGPGQTDTPSVPLTAGAHTFCVQATDRAQNTDYSAAKQTFTVAP
jgi:Glycosyl hydrolase catalytic core